MKLWTIQTHGWFQNLMTKKSIFATYSRVSYDMRDPYKWMAKQMAHRIGSNAKKCPTFAWYKYFGENQGKPDLRSTWHLSPGTPGVCVELDINEKEVLLSQFEMWHCVLNHYPLSGNQREELKHEQLQVVGKWTNEMTINTWDRIFDLQFGDWRFWGKRAERGIQACIESVAIKNIRKVDFFVAR